MIGRSKIDNNKFAFKTHLLHGLASVRLIAEQSNYCDARPCAAKLISRFITFHIYFWNIFHFFRIDGVRIRSSVSLSSHFECHIQYPIYIIIYCSWSINTSPDVIFNPAQSIFVVFISRRYGWHLVQSIHLLLNEWIVLSVWHQVRQKRILLNNINRQNQHRIVIGPVINIIYNLICVDIKLEKVKFNNNNRFAKNHYRSSMARRTRRVPRGLVTSMRRHNRSPSFLTTHSHVQRHT